MKYNALFLLCLTASIPTWAQNSIGGSTGGSNWMSSGRTDDAQAQSGAINSFITNTPNSGRTTVVDQGGGVFNIQTGNGDMHFGVTQLGSTRIVGTKGDPVNCVTTFGVTNCQ